jgi:hypothetical protein
VLRSFRAILFTSIVRRSAERRYDLRFLRAPLSNIHPDAYSAPLHSDSPRNSLVTPERGDGGTVFTIPNFPPKGA